MILVYFEFEMKHNLNNAKKLTTIDYQFILQTLFY